MTGTSPPDDLYQLLGIPPDASAADITRAYRRRARAVHPDARPDDADGSARFRALAAAYRVLGDPARRAAYDRSLSPAETSPLIQSTQYQPSTQFPHWGLFSWPTPPVTLVPPTSPGSPAGFPGPGGFPAQAALWAGPTMVEPPTGAVAPPEPPPRSSPASSSGPSVGPPPGPASTGPAVGRAAADRDRVRLALLALLLARHLDRTRDWPW